MVCIPKQELGNEIEENMNILGISIYYDWYSSVIAIGIDFSISISIPMTIAYFRAVDF